MSAAPHTPETAPGITVATGNADETRALGARLTRLLRAGDLVMLSGGLGAGKTTLAQGIGAALEVRGRVSSPTFIIARVHPALSDGPDLIHVDAYRITSLEEIDALDLDSSLERAVTLVEWGEEKVEALSPDRLEIQVLRPHGAVRAELPQPRRIKLMPVIFSVIMRPSPPATPAYQARNTIGLTVPPPEARQQEV